MTFWNSGGTPPSMTRVIHGPLTSIRGPGISPASIRRRTLRMVSGAPRSTAVVTPAMSICLAAMVMISSSRSVPPMKAYHSS